MELAPHSVSNKSNDAAVVGLTHSWTAGKYPKPYFRPGLFNPLQETFQPRSATSEPPQSIPDNRFGIVANIAIVKNSDIQTDDISQNKTP